MRAKYYSGYGPVPKGYRLPNWDGPKTNDPELIEQRKRESEARLAALKARLDEHNRAVREQRYRRVKR